MKEKTLLLDSIILTTPNHREKDWSRQERRINNMIPRAVTLTNDRIEPGKMSELDVSRIFLSAMDFLTHQAGLRVLTRTRTNEVYAMFV